MSLHQEGGREGRGGMTGGLTGFACARADPKYVRSRDKREWVAKGSSRIWRDTLATEAWVYRRNGCWVPASETVRKRKAAKRKRRKPSAPRAGSGAPPRRHPASGSTPGGGYIPIFPPARPFFPFCVTLFPFCPPLFPSACSFIPAVCPICPLLPAPFPLFSAPLKPLPAAVWLCMLGRRACRSVLHGMRHVMRLQHGCRQAADEDGCLGRGGNGRRGGHSGVHGPGLGSRGQSPAAGERRRAQGRHCRPAAAAAQGSSRAEAARAL